MLKCKSATLTTDGGINTVWEDSKDETSKWEIMIESETAEALIDYVKWEKEKMRIREKWEKEIKKDED